MTDTTPTIVHTGVNFRQLLAVLLIGLKLTGHISWHWIWVTSPLWIGWTVAILAVLFGGLYHWAFMREE